MRRAAKKFGADGSGMRDAFSTSRGIWRVCHRDRLGWRKAALMNASRSDRPTAPVARLHKKGPDDFLVGALRFEPETQVQESPFGVSGPSAGSSGFLM